MIVFSWFRGVSGEGDDEGSARSIFVSVGVFQRDCFALTRALEAPGRKEGEEEEEKRVEQQEEEERRRRRRRKRSIVVR